MSWLSLGNNNMNREKEQIDAFIKSAQHVATNNPCPPHQGGGEYYMGWPVIRLVQSVAPAHMVGRVVDEIRNRNGGMSNTLATTSISNSTGAFTIPGHVSVGSLSVANQRQPSDHEMLAMRMRWPGDPRAVVNYGKFKGLYVWRGENKVLIFVVNPMGEPATLEDDPNMFPSDQLVTSLRLLEG